MTHRQVHQQPGFRFHPEFGAVGKVLPGHHHEDVEVGEIAAHWVLDPIAARITAEQDDLENTTLPILLVALLLRRSRKALAQCLDHEIQFAALGKRQGLIGVRDRFYEAKPCGKLHLCQGKTRMSK